MNRIEAIPVRVEPACLARPADVADPALPLSAIALAVLHEIESLLCDLRDRGEGGAIDMLRLPMPAPERRRIAEILGEGEVHATLDAQGISVVRETAIPCVWWITHRDADGEVQAETVEVTRCPALLVGDPDAISGGLSDLARRRAAAAAAEHSNPRNLS